MERTMVAMRKTKTNKNATTKEAIHTHVVFCMYTYSFFMLLAMLILGHVIYGTIININDNKISDINSIVEIDNKKDLNAVTSQQGTFEVLISGKISTYGTIKNKELGKNLVYVRQTTYNNESGEQVGEDIVKKSDFVNIYDMNFNANKLMLLEPSITSTKIENGLRTEYSAISKGTEVTIQGTIENGVLRDGARLYTTTTVDEIKKGMDTSSNPNYFVVMWTILTVLLIYLPMFIVTKKMSFKHTEKPKSNRMPTPREYIEKKPEIEIHNHDDDFSTKDISDISEKLKSNNPMYDTPRQPKPKGGNSNYNNTKKPTTKNYNRKQPVKTTTKKGKYK